MFLYVCGHIATKFTKFSMLVRSNCWTIYWRIKLITLTGHGCKLCAALWTIKTLINKGINIHIFEYFACMILYPM